jgi:5-formaminoimidazole-4-carboxamide-1-beta-D-ribofuranosyl 5'-monophosphate synthetase
LQVGAIIAKLPPNWNDYRKKLIHTTEDFTIEQIQKHLRIEEETRIRDKNLFFPSSSKVNFVGEKNKFQNNHGGNKRKLRKEGTSQARMQIQEEAKEGWYKSSQ